MNQRLNELLKKFEKEKEQLEQELKEFAVESNEPGDYNARFPRHESDPESNAFAVQEMDRIKALERELEERLSVVNTNIKKIKEGNYGICENCSAKIQKKRLQAMPTAFLCVTCASRPRR